MNGKSFMNTDEMELCINNLEMYKVEEEKVFFKICESLDIVLSNYKTNNTLKLEKLQNQLHEKINVISKNNYNNIEVLKYNKSIYINTVADVKNIFSGENE